jgi:outer membrane lipoprotein-sorting protein
VSAETVLDRAETAASSGATTVSTYHLLMTRTIKDSGVTMSEVWFAGPDRQRTAQRVMDSHGALQSSQDAIFNGPETWIEITENGQTRAIHTTGTTWTKPADNPSSYANLADLLQAYGNKTCMAVRLEQTPATIAGQATYVIIATQQARGCAPSISAWVAPSPSPAGGQPGIRVNGQPQGSLIPEPIQFTLWVDKQSFLPLKTEVRDASGVVLDRSEVTSIQYNEPIAATTFQYGPRPGVPVATFTGGDGADVKRALFTGKR